MSALSDPDLSSLPLARRPSLPCVLERRSGRRTGVGKSAAFCLLTAASYVAWLYLLDHW